MTKKEFMYECAMRAMQGSFANPADQLSPARMVRDAERLWNELQEWEQQEMPEVSEGALQ